MKIFTNQFQVNPFGFLQLLSCVVLLLAALAGQSQVRYDISSEEGFYDIRDQANPGDSIIWEMGLYKDVFMVINRPGIIVIADSPGSVVFTGSSKVDIEADDVVLSGFQFVGGDIGSDNVINNFGSDVLITQINIQSYESFKYLVVDEDSRRTTISYCNFENRINLSDQNILSILVDNEPGFHKIQYCSFRNFRGTGNDMGIEPIRIGVSSQSHLDSRSIVEYCYFENCNGDGEIISYKATQNVIRYNTFINNPVAELVLRHGDEAIVYGNFFLNNMGGIRVREGQDHYIYNNYFSGITRRAIYLQNESSDPLDSIHIYFNTIVDSEEVLLDASGNNPPQHVVFANNIFAMPKTQLFTSPTGTEEWISNISFGNLGISRPSGLTELDPRLAENDSGFFQLSSESSAIDAATSGFPPIPSIEGLLFDDLKLDLMKQVRPDVVEQKDIGASEFPNLSDVQPHATAFNTGTSYVNDVEEKYSIITSVVGEGSVEVIPSKELYAFGEIVALQPVPSEGFQFTRWSGDRIGTDNPKSIGIVQDLNVVAEFSLIPEPEEPLIVSEDDAIRLFPNPSGDLLQILFPDELPDQIEVLVHDINGKQMFKEELSNAVLRYEVNISTLPPGMYYITLQYILRSSSLVTSSMLKMIKE